MADKIYVRKGDDLEPMEEQGFPGEGELQELIADHLELLDGELITPGDARRWILITREQGIADSPDSGDRWSLDHLLIDQDATPTLVEVKLRDNSEVRRKVVGQMLDYAAHAGYWTVEKLRQTFESKEGHDEKLQSLFAEEIEGEDAWEERKTEFWQAVETKLAAKRLRLLFVADAIPATLAHVVEFLNEQMPRIEVLAVEVKQFKGESGQTLVPRVYGHTAPLPGIVQGNLRGRSPITIDEFMHQLPREVRATAERLIGVTTKRGGKVVRNDKSLTLRVDVPKEFSNPPITVAWLYPVPDIAFWSGTKNFSFGSANYHEWSEPLHSTMDSWVGQFANDDFGEYATDGNLRVRVLTYEQVVQHEEVLKERLAEVIEKLRALRSA